jgi:hypothetical protein
MKRGIWIHPFLFSFFVFAAPLVDYIGELESAMAVRFLLISVLVNVVGILVFWRITRDVQHAAFLCTILWISISLTSLPMLSGLPITFFLVRIAWYILLGLWLLICFFLVRKSFWGKIRKPYRITNWMTAVGLAAISYSTAVMVIDTVKLENWRNAQSRWVEAGIPPVSSREVVTPDIYYIILDGYAREDVLREMYGEDNQPFLEGLSGLGFYVADEAHTNYVQTILSLASSLNLTYLDGQVRQWGEDSRNRKLPSDMIAHSLAQAFLESRGYRTVEVASGYFPTELPDAEVRLGSDPPYSLNAYEQFWVQHTPFQVFIPTDEQGQPVWGYAAHRERLVEGFDRLAQLSGEDGPKFVFAHILAPHPPFVLREDGLPIEPDRLYNIGDGGHYAGTDEEYVSGYAGQVRYVNRRLMEVLPLLIKNSNRPVIIVLQGDHGPGSKLDWDSAEKTCIWERSSILNAYYLPETFRTGLYPSMTPVNLFRWIFREVFGENYPRLEDRTYYSTWGSPFRMEDVTDRVSDPCQD